jgi:hypothetical protein
MFYFSESDVQELLPITEAIRLMRMTFQALAQGRAQNQPRRRLMLESGSVLHSMAGLNFTPPTRDTARTSIFSSTTPKPPGRSP